MVREGNSREVGDESSAFEAAVMREGKSQLEVDSRVLEKLGDRQEKEGSLPEILEFYRALLRIQVEARAAISTAQPRLTKTKVSVQIRKGIPLLKWDALSADWPTFQNLFQAAIAAIDEHTTSECESLRKVVADTALLEEATRTWYEGSSLSPWAGARGIDEELLAAAIHCAIKPFLTSKAESLIGLVPQKQWRREYCPICGGKPDFAYLDKERGSRWLVCSRCDSEWLFQRLGCPYCGNNDPEAQAYFASEDDLYRLYTCQSCKTYLKAIDLRHTESEVLLPLERVLTVDMDRQGQEQGYRGGWAGTAPDEQ